MVYVLLYEACGVLLVGDQGSMVFSRCLVDKAGSSCVENSLGSCNETHGLGVEEAAKSAKS